MAKQCPNCGTANRDDARFCFNCATPLVSEILCPSCGTANQPQARFCYYCATPLKGTTPQTGMLQPNAILTKRYIIIRRVGGGGMGAVYQATDQRIQSKLWAIKEMSDAAITNPLERQQAVDAFRREAQFLATLDHGNLPKLNDYFTEGGKHYLVMDFIQGRTLEEVLDSAPGFLDEDEVAGWAVQLCEVLAYLHSRQPPVIFRDLKPGNIMLDAEGRIKLIDFGIARLFHLGKGRDTQVMGTPGYAAPEQHGTGQTDGRADIYALGVTLHQLLTGYDPALSPFSLPPARSINPGLSPTTEAVIAKATQADVNSRYQTATEMHRALCDVTVGLPVQTPAQPTGQPSVSQSERSSIWFFLGCGLLMMLILLGAIGYLVWQPVKPDGLSPPRENTALLRANLGSEPPTLDPTLATDTASVTCDKQLFLGLTAFEKDTPNVIPELAKMWSASDDDLTWTFEMRHDVKWVNYNPETKVIKEIGPVTARDVVYGIKRTLDPETASDYAYVLYIIKGAEAANTGEGSLDDVGVRAVDDYTVEFTLENAAGYFPAIAGMWMAHPQPKWAIEKFGEKWTEPGNIVTNGPYMLESWEHEAKMVMVKNPKYYDADNVQIERIEWVMVQEDSTEMTMYENNELDAIGGDLGWGPPLEDMDRVKADPVLGKELKIVSRLCTYYYGFVNTKPPFNNHLVRKAFSAAIDRQSLIDNVTRGEQIPAIHFATPGIFGAPPLDEVGIEYDPRQARKWLAEAGYPNGEGFPEVILMHNVSEAHAKIAQAITAMWKETLNVDVKIETQEWNVYLETLNKNTPVENVPHIFRIGWCADYPDENNWVHEVFNAKAGANRVRRGCLDSNCSQVRLSKFDELTEQAAVEQDPEKRKELYREAERILIEEETAIAPIYHYTRITMSKPWVTERYDSPLAGSPIKDWRIDVEAQVAATAR